MQMKTFTQQTNLPPKTIRYYEEIGLLPAPKRLDNGYRDYNESDVVRAKFVAKVRKMGFSLAEIRQILALREKEGSPCDYVTGLVENELALIDAKIEALKQLRIELEIIQNKAQANSLPLMPEEDYICHLLEK